MTMTHSPWLHCGEDHSDCRSMVRTGPGRCTQGVYYDAAAYHDNDDDDERVIDDGSWSVQMSPNEYREVCLSVYVHSRVEIVEGLFHYLLSSCS